MSLPLPAVRDSLGVHPLYYREDGATVAGTIKELLHLGSPGELRPDRKGIESYLRGDPDDQRTCVQGIRLVPTGHRLDRDRDGWRLTPPPPLPEPQGTLPDALAAAVADILAPRRRIALALSGGLDSALALAIAHHELGRRLPVFTLAIDIPGYGEVETTRRMAEHFGVELHEIPATAEDYLDALPEAVAAVEVPMFNPHPVSKLLLARALRREGFDAVLTGDAADQVFSAAPQRNYLPLVGRLLRSQGIEPCSPFFHERVRAHAAAHPPDPHKRALRDAARRWLPPSTCDRPKVRRLAPDFRPERRVGRAAITGLCERLGVPLCLDDARSRCARATLCMLWSTLSTTVAARLPEPA